jgi:hypothetical protein
MNFEFDPNDNIDRAADGNDLQDIGILGGEGRLFDRVPGGSQVGAANRSQGQAQGGLSLGDQCLPLERQGQAQARGGLGQAQGGQVPRSAGQAQGLLGMLGRVPSQVSLAASAASASVIPASEYFVGTQKHQAIEINARRVICPKHA